MTDSSKRDAWLMPVPSGYRSWRHVAGETARAVLQMMAREFRCPLVLTGPTGTGKTSVGLLIRDIYRGWYADLSSLHERLQDVHGGTVYYPPPAGTKITTGEFWNMWRTQSLTVLDEIGVRRPTDAQYETLKKAIDSREGRLSVLVTNLSLDGIREVYDDRIARRMDDGTVIQLRSRIKPIKEV